MPKENHHSKKNLHTKENHHTDEAINTNAQTPCTSKPILIVSGLSGAGMSTALQVFEDLNFFTADGLPPTLIKEFSALAKKPDMQHFKGLALGIDTRREKKDAPLQELMPALDKIRQDGQSISIIFLEASNDSIMKRYATTRRPHPLEIEGLTLETAIIKERKLLEPIKTYANIVFDTSNYSLHDLRRAIQRQFNEVKENTSAMHINLISFGFKYGVPKEADMVFDVRFLPNPYFVEELRTFSGQDENIVQYIFKEKSTRDFRDKFLEYLQFTLPYFDKEGRYRLCIAIGCTGGRHRSVAITEFISKALIQSGYAVTLEHRHLNLD